MSTIPSNEASLAFDPRLGDRRTLERRQPGELAPITSEPEPLSGWAWLTNLVRRLFGGGPDAAVTLAAVTAISTDPSFGDDAASGGAFVVAPGGYRIRVPRVNDVNQTIDNMLPSVRQGLDLVPPLPTVVAELLREIQKPNASGASVAAILSTDPALVASLIRTVNSAAFGMLRKITSVTEAVSYLGFASVKAIVLRLQLDRMLSTKGATDADAADVEDAWAHSLVVSQIAETLARRVPGVDTGFVSTLGLLHDIGKLVAYTQFREEAKKTARCRCDR